MGFSPFCAVHAEPSSGRQASSMHIHTYRLQMAMGFNLFPGSEVVGNLLGTCQSKGVKLLEIVLVHAKVRE